MTSSRTMQIILVSFLSVIGLSLSFSPHNRQISRFYTTTCTGRSTARSNNDVNYLYSMQLHAASGKNNAFLVRERMRQARLDYEARLIREEEAAEYEDEDVIEEKQIVSFNLI